MIILLGENAFCRLSSLPEMSIIKAREDRKEKRERMANFSQLIQNGSKPARRQLLFAVLTLSWPAIIEQVMITMVQYVDTAMVGALGPNATAAVGINQSTVWLFNGFINAVAIGFSVQVAQYIGAQDTGSAKKVVRQALLFNILFGLCLASVAVGISFGLPYWLGAEPQVAPAASQYFRIVA